MKNTIIATGLLLAAALLGCHGTGHFRSPPPAPYQTVSMQIREPRHSPADHEIPYSFGHEPPGSRMYYSYLWQGYRGFEIEHDIYGMYRHSRLPGVEEQYHATAYPSEVTVDEFFSEDENVRPDELADDDEAIPSAPPIVEPAPVRTPVLEPVPEDEALSNESSTDSGHAAEQSPVWEFSPRPPLVHPAPARPSLPAEQHRHRIPRNNVPTPEDVPSARERPRIPRNNVPTPVESPSEPPQHRIPRNSVPAPVNSHGDRIPRNDLPG